jgi:hypothetical protein
VIIVSENNNIPWADDIYLTVLDFYELWPIYPRIIQDPSNAENVIFYKDYDVAYTNQNTLLGTYVNAGPHRAALLDPASGLASIYYSSTGTYNLKGNTLTYDWFFEGATVTGSTSADPGYLTYNTPGHYVTRLIVTDSAGASDVTYRYVSIYNQANPPIQRWEIDSLQGSRGEGGYSVSLKLFDIAPIEGNSVVVIFGENEYGNTQANLGGNYPNAGDILFAGYVDRDSIEYDYEHSEVKFDAVSLTGLMKKSSGFSVSVESVVTPTTWYELLDMDTRRALYHYLRWHTTALSLADFQFVGDDWKIQFFDSERESMYDALDNHMKNTLIGDVVSDRQGKVWMEVQAQAYMNPTGSFPPIMQITNRDWLGQPSIEERINDEISYAEYGGVAYSGITTGTFAALIGSAPGTAPGFYGTIQNHQGLALQGQMQLNQLVGNIFANGNTRYPSVNMDMAINASNLDIAPQETLNLILAASDTVRNRAINGLYIPESISWKYDPKDYLLLPNVEMKQLVTGRIGETVLIPPPEDVGDGWSVPSFSVPPLPDIFIPVFPENATGDTAPARVLVWDADKGLIYTNTFNTPSPQWFQVNGGLTPTQYQAINFIVVCPNGAIYVGTKNNPNGFFARASSVGSPFTILYDQTAIDTLYGDTNTRLVDMQCDRTKSESVALIIVSAVSGTNAKLFLGSQTTWTLKQTLGSWFGGFGYITAGSNRWLATAIDGEYWSLSPDLSSTLDTGNISPGTTDMYFHVRAGTTDKTFHWVGSSSQIALCSDNAGTEFLVTLAGSNTFTGIEVDDTGVFLICKLNTGFGIYTYYKSSDGGYSWSSVANLPLTGVWACSTNVRGFTSKWIACGAYVWYSGDFFNSYPVDKRGNILTISPILDIRIVRAIG